MWFNKICLGVNKKMVKTNLKGKTDKYVFDVSLDGTVVNALGYNVNSNTDGPLKIDSHL